MDKVDQIWRILRRRCRMWQRHCQRMASDTSTPIDAKSLEDRTLYSVTPVILDALQVHLVEDAADSTVDLAPHFTADDGGSPTDYSIADRSGDALFDRTLLSNDGRLTIDLEADQFGNAELMVEASNRAGITQWLPVQIEVLPLNDTPTTSGIVNIREPAGTDRTIIDLFAAFDDVEDGPRGLTYSLDTNTDPSLFKSVTINQQRGTLTLDYADNATGAATLTVVATDSGGLSVGLAADDQFKVYNEIHGIGGDGPDTDRLDLAGHDLWTGGRFFVGKRGAYKFDQIDYDRYDRFLAAADASIPHTFDIENSFFDNSPEGRDRFAELLSYAKSQRPDLDIGIYRILPERQWFDPVQWYRAQHEASLGLTTWFTDRAQRLESEYDAWKERSALYRTEAVSSQFGGGTVADLVDIVNPSLYTLYRNEKVSPIWRDATLDPRNDTISVDGPSFEFVDKVWLHYANDATLNNGLSRSKEYHVVNAQGSTFQVAATAGGTPIDFNSNFSGRIFAGARDYDYVWHDPDVVYWKIYAEENIAEARKYGKPVYAWLKPTMHQDASQSLDYDFFRWQLEVVRPLVDGIVIYEDPIFDGAHQMQQEWWRALVDFMSTMNGPNASFRVSVQASQAPDDGDPVDLGTPVNDTLSAKEDTTATWSEGRLLANDIGVDHRNSIRFSQPTHGTLEQLADGSVRYTPDADYHGIDQFRYRVTDGRSESEVATVEIRVSPENDAPVTRNDRVESIEDQVAVIELEDLLRNDKDIDGDSLNFRIVSGPAHGDLVLDENGMIRYRPDANYDGMDRFLYRVNDGSVGSNIATVVIDVAGVNDLPRAVPDVFTTNEDTPLALSESALLENDRDADMDRLEIKVVDQPSHGRIQRGSQGKLIYRPDRDFHGTDQFGYLVTDGRGRSKVVAVMVHVLPQNDDPVVVDDRYTIRSGRELQVDRRVGVLANDRDVDRDELRARLLTGPLNGEVTLNADGSFTYVPANGFSGVDRFEYVALDDNGGRTVGEVALRVTPLGSPSGDPPIQPPATPRNPPTPRGDDSGQRKLLPTGNPLMSSPR